MFQLLPWMLHSNNWNDNRMMVESFLMKPHQHNRMVAPFLSSLRANQRDATTALHAKPRRLEDNVDGVVYVNDQCINCGACHNFAPATFTRHGSHHVVYRQPETLPQIEDARAALAACPVAAIRIDSSKTTTPNAFTVMHPDQHQNTILGDANAMATTTTMDAVATKSIMDDEQLIKLMSLNGKHNHLPNPFPRPFLNDPSTGIYWLGYHNERSFGATPYLFRAKHEGNHVWIMVDTPKFSISAVKAIFEVTNHTFPDYLFLTHVDDTADHNLWKDYFQATLKRIFHSGDLGRNNWLGDQTLESVEVLLPSLSNPNKNMNDHDHSTFGLTSYTLDGQPVEYDDWVKKNDSDVIIFHTPGHSSGSITLFQRPNNDHSHGGVLFTGDSYAHTPYHGVGVSQQGGRMTGFPRYGRDRSQQAHVLSELLKLPWMIIAPGHGHPRDYRPTMQGSTAYQDDIKTLQAVEMKGAIDELNQYNTRRW